MVEYRIFFLEIINGESTSSVMTFSHKWPPLNSRLTQTSLQKKNISICSPSRQAQVEAVTWCGGSYNTIRSSFSVSHLPFFQVAFIVLSLWKDGWRSTNITSSWGNLVRKTLFREHRESDLMVWWLRVPGSPWTSHCGSNSYLNSRMNADEGTDLVAP